MDRYSFKCLCLRSPRSSREIVQHKQEGGLDGDTVRLSPPKKTEVASGHDRSSRRERRVFRLSPLINSSVSPQLSTLPWEPHFLPRLHTGFELR